MDNKSTFNSKSLDTLTIQEVSVRFKNKDFDATKKWLYSKNVTIHKDSKTHYVYAIDVDCEIDINFVRDLKRKYPNNWEDLYRTISKDNAVCEMVLFKMNGQLSPTTKLKIKNNDDVDLFKKLSA